MYKHGLHKPETKTTAPKPAPQQQQRPAVRYTLSSTGTLMVFEGAEHYREQNAK